MKNIMMLFILFSSCTLHNYPADISMFLMLMSCVWMGVLGYIYHRVTKRNNSLTFNEEGGIGYMIITFIFSMMNPVLCLFCILLYQPYIFSRYLHLFSKVKVNSNENNNRSYSAVRSSFFYSEDLALSLNNGKPLSDVFSSCHALERFGSVTVEDNNIHGFNVASDTDYSISHSNNCSVTDSYNDINPANGLPMIGSVDIFGNTYGTDGFNNY